MKKLLPFLLLVPQLAWGPLRNAQGPASVLDVVVVSLVGVEDSAGRLAVLFEEFPGSWADEVGKDLSAFFIFVLDGCEQKATGDADG